MRIAMISSLAIVSVALQTSVVCAAVATLGPSKDSTIYQNNVNNSSGAGNGLFAGTNGTSSPRRGLLAFDVAGNIPAGSTIQSVQLTLFLGQVAGSGGGGGGGNPIIDLHRLSADWGEGVAQQSTPPSDTLGGQGQGVAANAGDATWNARFFPSTLWSSPGGDFVSTVSASASVGTTLNSGFNWGSTATLVSDVQGWLNAPATNFGWSLVNEDETSATTFRAFYTRETATVAFHPQLQITFQPLPEPSSIALAGLAFASAVILIKRVKHRAT